MKRIQVLFAFSVVAILILLAGWAFAGDGKAQGQPFQYLQQQIDQLRGQIPIQPDVKGCWAGSFIVTTTGGSAASENGMPVAMGTPGQSFASPYYWSPGRKHLHQMYVTVDSQSGTQISGTYYSWIGAICLSPNGDSIPGCISGQFYEFPFEGHVSGNLFQLYTSTDVTGPSPYNSREEQRYLNGILTEDSLGKKVIHGMGLTSRDMAAGTDQTKHSWNNIVWTFTMEPYEGLCSELPAPNLGDITQGQIPPYYGWLKSPQP